ncbi:DUF6292 family protein [Streptomyces sp. NPDC001205]
MIRAGRAHLVLTLAGLAETEGVSLGTYKNKRLHRRPGFPRPISSPEARVLLWDGEQVAAFLAGDPIPALPAQDDLGDLLDQHEAPQSLAEPVSARSWEVYRNDELLASALVDVAGVPHWPRAAVQAWDAGRPGRGHGGGRKVGSRQSLPREEIVPRIQALLNTTPGVTRDQAAEQLGVHHDTAQRALTSVRTARVRELLGSKPELTAEDVAENLGYPLRAARHALSTAHAQQRAARHAPYVEAAVEAVEKAGVPVADQPGIMIRPGATCAAAIALGPGAPAPSLVWDERYGWRTDPQAQVPFTKEDAPPVGAGIRYLGLGTTPAPATVAEALVDRRKGTKRPRPA